MPRNTFLRVILKPKDAYLPRSKLLLHPNIQHDVGEDPRGEDFPLQQHTGEADDVPGDRVGENVTSMMTVVVIVRVRWNFSFLAMLITVQARNGEKIRNDMDILL